jgi:hypothetical protein
MPVALNSAPYPVLLLFFYQALFPSSSLLNGVNIRPLLAFYLVLSIPHSPSRLISEGPLGNSIYAISILVVATLCAILNLFLYRKCTKISHTLI